MHKFRRQWSTRNWHFVEWFSKTLKNNTIRRKKFATTVSGRKNVASLQQALKNFVRRKLVSTSAEL